MKWLVRSAMCALYPPTEDLPGIEDTEVDAFLDQFKSETTPIMWAGVVMGSVVFAATPPLTVRVPLPAFLLGKEARDRHAAKIAGHPLYLVRQSVFLVKLAAGLCWGQHPDVREGFSLDPYGDDPATWQSDR